MDNKLTQLTTRERNAIKLIGKRSGKLVVYDYKISDSATETILYCHCDCGNDTQTKINTFRYGMKKSCGCLRKEAHKGIHIPKTNNHKYGNITMAEYRRLYSKYKNMKIRCYDDSYRCFDRYGGREIKVCNEWLQSSQSFIKWAINNGGLDRTLTLDRINNDGDYSPDNCRFVSMKIQNRNRWNNRKVVFLGKERLMIELAEEYNIDIDVLRDRIDNGWEIEHALTTPVSKSNKKRGNRINV